jgi:diaminopimelate epimerase
MKVEITYMSGAGNLFSVIDNRFYNFNIEKLKSLAPVLCRINNINKIKTDGLLALENSDEEKAFKAEFFNPDGSYSAMCGNGSRCAVHFALANEFFTLKNKNEIFEFEMVGKIFKGSFVGNNIKIYLPPPNSFILNIDINYQKNIFKAAYVDVNSWHLIINFNQFEKYYNIDFLNFNINEFAIPFRYNSRFLPHGVNVDFFELADNKTILLRTFERGVEGETGACGTGAVSTAFIAARLYNLEFPIRIIPTSKSPLWIDYIGNFPDNIEYLTLLGNAEILDTDYIEI